MDWDSLATVISSGDWRYQMCSLFSNETTTKKRPKRKRHIHNERTHGEWKFICRHNLFLFTSRLLVERALDAGWRNQGHLQVSNGGARLCTAFSSLSLSRTVCDKLVLLQTSYRIIETIEIVDIGQLIFE